MRPFTITCGLVLGVLSVFPVAETAGQEKLIRLEGDGRLGPEADEHRHVSSGYGWEGTPHSVIPRMIELAAVNEHDVAYEPGCGDARIVIAAVQAGARKGLGVDIDPDLAEVCYARVKAAGLEDRIEVYWGNALDVDMSEVTVVFLFMGKAFNMVMRPLLWEQLAVGSRVVSNDFSMGDWEPDETVSVEALERTYVLYLWTITPEIKRSGPGDKPSGSPRPLDDERRPLLEGAADGYCLNGLVKVPRPSYEHTCMSPSTMKRPRPPCEPGGVPMAIPVPTGTVNRLER